MAERTCSIDGCESPLLARGWCRFHYNRWHRHGSLELPPRKPRRQPAQKQPKGMCAIEGCDRVASRRGWCTKHYRRWWRTGATSLPSAPDRFWPKVNKLGPLAKNDPTLGPCWEWQGNYGSGPYGLFWSGERMMNSHKFAYELLVGPVPEGLELDHFGCDNKRCCNPAHLKAVTRLENMRRVWEARTHCKHGHPFDEVNTYWRPDGLGRDCRTCRTAALARRDTKRQVAGASGGHS